MTNADMDSYVELRAMSWYSFLEGASSIDEMVARAHELGYTALGLTDRHNLTGAIEFADAADEFGIKPIIGVTLNFQWDDDHDDGDDGADEGAPDSGDRSTSAASAAAGTHEVITMLAEDERGYANLANLISFAHITAAQRTEPVLNARYLQGRTDGIIALVGSPESRIAQSLSQGHFDEANQSLCRFASCFNRDSVFVEIQRHYVHGDALRNRRLTHAAQLADLPTVATGGVVYHHRSRSRLHDVLTAIRHNRDLDTSHLQRKANSRYALRSPEAMRHLFRQYPEAVRNSCKIAARCMSFNVARVNYSFPQEPVPPGFDSQQHYLESMCMDAAKRRYGDITDKIQTRLDKEFALIAQHGLAGFFLLYNRVIELAKDVAIELGHTSREIPVEERPPGRGRGSSVAMLVGTLMGLSHIDPMEYDLPLERFLPDDALVNTPDIDLDFPRDIREKLILRVFDEFGWDHAALTAMIPTYRIKGVIRDVGKVLGLPRHHLESLAKRAESRNARDMRDEMLANPDLCDKVDAPGWRDLIDVGMQLQGFPKGLAQHPGGMIISSKPLIDITPVQPSAMDGRYICQWDKDSADRANFLKIDFLALGALSQMQECLQLIADKTGKYIDISRVDLQDQDVYADITSGHTVGVFQVESAAQMQTITRLRPQNLYDLALEVAAVRPGVGANNGVAEFIRRRNGQPWEYDHPLEERALSKSLGIILFQDQVVQLGMDIAGFTATEADQMRRAFQRRNNERTVARNWRRFLEGATERGVDPQTAEVIFQKFNPHYMFPEAHAIAFAATAYHMAWLRRHYPNEFFTAIFNAQPMGFWPLETLKQDALKRGVTVLKPDVNLSDVKCTPASINSFRIGLSFIHGIDAASANTLIANRVWLGPYTSLADVVSRSGLQRRAIESLVKSGACDALDGVTDRRKALWEVGLRYAASQDQARLGIKTDHEMAQLAETDASDRMAFEYQTLSLWTEGHVMGQLRPGMDERIVDSRTVAELPDGSTVLTAGKVLRRQKPLGKMVFMTLEDEFGMIPLAIAPRYWKIHRDALKHPIVAVSGKVSRKDNTLNIHVNGAWPLGTSSASSIPRQDISKNFR